MPRIRFLTDEKLPVEVAEFLRQRGHAVAAGGDAFPKASPDALLVAAAEQHGYVVVTFDRDFKRLIQQVPIGRRRQFAARAGRISLTCREDQALARISTLIELIEFSYDLARRDGRRLVMQISMTSFTVAG